MVVVWEGKEIKHTSRVTNVIETGSALLTESSCKRVTDLLCAQRKANNLCELFSLLTSERSFPAGGESASWFAGDTFKVARSPRFVMHLSVAGNEGGKSFTWLARPIRPAKDNKAHSGLRRCVKYPHCLALSHSLYSCFIVLRWRLKRLLNKQNGPDPGRRRLALLDPGTSRAWLHLGVSEDWPRGATGTLRLSEGWKWG